MLEATIRVIHAADEIQKLPCLVELSDDLKAEQGRIGQAPSRDGDPRRMPRFRVFRRIGLELVQTLPALERPLATWGAYLRDASQRALGILYHQQLFPGEQVRVWLPKGKMRGVIVRCRKRGWRCYEAAVLVERAIHLRDLG